MRHKHSFKKYFIPSILFIVGIIIGFGFLFYISTTFTIKKVEVVGISMAEKTTIFALVKGMSTFIVQPPEIGKIIHSRFPTMEIQSSTIQFPDTLVLVIKKEKAFAYVRTDYGYLALTKNGTVIEKERSVNVPQPSITFYQTLYHSQYQAGQKIGFSSIERALLFISLLADEGYQTETVAIDSVDMIACKTRGFEVAFSQSRPVQLQSHEVRQIIRQIKAGALRIARLDLRFDKPVVQLPQK